jgi:hypothetical protein
MLRLVILVSAIATFLVSITLWYSAPAFLCRPQAESAPLATWDTLPSLVPEESWLKNAGKIYLYRVLSALDSVQVASVNGSPVSHVSLKVLPIQDEKMLACLEIENAERAPSPVQSVHVQWSSGHVSTFSGRLAPAWYVGRSQYEFPLRVVNCEVKGGAAELLLYNESNSKKPELEILGASIDGRDVTELSKLPQAPLPPDHGRYLADLRKVSIPWDSTKARHEIELKYRLLPLKANPKLELDTSIQRTQFGMLPNLRFPIGGVNTASIAECICVYHGGLEQPISDTAFWDRLRVARQAQTQLPIYARFDEHASARRVIELGRDLDFAVVAPPFTELKGSAELTADPGKYLHPVAKALPEVIASFHLGAKDPAPTQSDLHWLVMSAVGHGSRGIKCYTEANIDRHSYFEWLNDQKSWLAGGQSAPLVTRVNRPGVDVLTWACGANDIAIFCLNQFSSLAQGQLRKPFASVSRRGVDVCVRTGSSWASSAIASRCDDNRPVPVVLSQPGEWKIALPDFDSACLVRLTAVKEEATVRVTSHPIADEKSGKLEPRCPPFLNIGGAAFGESVRVEIPVANRAATPTWIKVLPHPWRSISGADAEFEPLHLDAHQEGTLHGVWRPPARSGAYSTSLRVAATERSDDGFLFFLEGEQHRRTNADPSSVVFPAAEVGGSVAEQIVGLQTDGKPEIVAEAKVLAIDPRLEVVVDQKGRAVVRFSPSKPGSCQATVVLKPANSSLSDVRVNVSADVYPTIQVFPPRLVIAQSYATKRTITMRSKRPFTVKVENPPPPGVLLLGNTDGLAAEHRLQLECDAAKTGLRTSGMAASAIRILCEVPGGNSKLITIPLDWLASITPAAKLNEQQAPGEPKQQLAPALAASLSKIDRLVGDIRSQELPEAAPAWIVAHSLLLYVPASSRTEKDAVRFRNTLERLLRPFGPASPHGTLSLYRDKPEFFKNPQLFDRQHHTGQFFKLLAFADVGLDTPLNFPGHSWTLADLFRNWLPSIQPSGEVSWILPALCSYQKPDEPWNDKFGRKQQVGLYVDRLLKHPDTACDRSHMMMALARIADDRRWRLDPSVAPLLAKVDQALSEESRVLQAGQKPDGSFSIRLDPSAPTQPSIPQDVIDQVIINGLGHHLDWLSTRCTVEELKQEWIVRAADRLLAAIEAEYPNQRYFAKLHTETDCFRTGNLIHAVAGLSRWREKISPNQGPQRR